MTDDFMKVATTDSLASGEMTLVTVGTEEVLLAKVGGEFFAISNDCSHALAPLHTGTLEDSEVECPFHGSRFNVKTGEATQGPASAGQKVYTVRVEGADVLVGPS
jgi:nitrite reductase/ring-hydroxylating ferredoxin subunit